MSNAPAPGGNPKRRTRILTPEIHVPGEGGMDDDDAPPRRKTDQSNRQVRRALAGSIEQIGRWRMDVAVMQARAGRPLSEAERTALRQNITAIEAGMMDIRMALIAELADAPPKIKGHSRVVDIEKALDNLEAALHELRRANGPAARPGHPLVLDQTAAADRC